MIRDLDRLERVLKTVHCFITRPWKSEVNKNMRSRFRALSDTGVEYMIEVTVDDRDRKRLQTAGGKPVDIVDAEKGIYQLRSGLRLLAAQQADRTNGK